ncbi:MAG: hypothetical protein ACMUJM_17705 [bacterium]
MKRLLVTGASGFLGWHICSLAAYAWIKPALQRGGPCSYHADPKIFPCRHHGLLMCLLILARPKHWVLHPYRSERH